MLKLTIFLPMFSQGTPASYTSKNGCHDLAEILLTNVVKHQKSLKFNRLEKLEYLERTPDHGQKNGKL
jgi:hypothetical protein